MAKKNKHKKSNFKDTSAEKVVISDFIEVAVDPAQTDLEDLIEEETKAFTEEERVGVVQESSKPQFKNPDRQESVKGMVMVINNDNLTEVLKTMLINRGMSRSEFI